MQSGDSLDPLHQDLTTLSVSAMAARMSHRSFACDRLRMVVTRVSPSVCVFHRFEGGHRARTETAHSRSYLPTIRTCEGDHAHDIIVANPNAANGLWQDTLPAVTAWLGGLDGIRTFALAAA